MIKHSIEYLYNLMQYLGLANNFSNRIAVNKGNNIKNADSPYTNKETILK